MNRLTIDYGIDLGTTNSSVACNDENGVRIFKNYLRQEHTPSVVRVDAKGARTVGAKAYDHLENDSENVAAEFKRWMGTTQKKTFLASGLVLGPEELSAEVLKSLKADILKTREEDVRSAVITVPALFELVQCEATQRAAKLAGFDHAPLLQEPIAAAMAYGFGNNSKDGFSMVYDLGGGTFDVSVVSVNDKKLSVLNHNGDNHLGGKDFDWKIVDEILLPRIREEYGMVDLVRGPEKYRRLMALLKQRAEAAKIELSENKSTKIDIFKNETGEHGIEMSFDISRLDYEKMIESRVRETIEICKRTLKGKNISSSAIEKVILVGGPTLTPYIREAIRSELRVKLDYEADPLTVVAQGAAIFASSIRKQDNTPVSRSGARDLKLAYTPFCSDVETVVGGKIAGGVSAGATIQIERADGGWQSGRLDFGDGSFVSSVVLREGKQNVFRIRAFGPDGTVIDCEPSEIRITNGISFDDAPLSRSVGVEIEDGTLSVHLVKGISVPCEKIDIYRSVSVGQPGQDSDFINIHVYEGEARVANRNRHLGTLKISGKDLKRPLPKNSDVEITISVDASRVAKAFAYIPLLDQRFENVLEDRVSPKPDLDILEKEILEEQNRAKSFGAEPTVAVGLDESKNNLEELKTHLEAARGGDPDAAERVQRKLQEVKTVLDELELATAFPKLVITFRDGLAEVKVLVQEKGTGEEKHRIGLLAAEGEDAIQMEDSVKLAKVNGNVDSLRWAVLFRQDEFWIGVFQSLAKDSGKLKGNARAEELLREGGQALQRQDIDVLKSVTSELWSLMSRDQRSEVGNRSNSGIRK